MNNVIRAATLAAALVPVAVSAAPRQAAPAPNVALTTTDGHAVALAGLRGRPVFLNFFASWCPYCNFEAESTEGIALAHPDVVVIGIDEAENAAVAEDFARRYGLTYTIAVDASGKIGDAFGIEDLPGNVFIDRSGHVAYANEAEMSVSEIAAALRKIT